MEIRVCKQCGQNFEISGLDTEFYKKIDVPFPKLCPKDRLRRRLAFRNERNLFRRKSDKTGREMISHFRPDVSVPVYHLEEWHADDWSPPFLPSYDFSKSFFEQFALLSRVAPRVHKASAGNEVNSEYINHAGNSKNCYFIFNSEYDEDCMYLRFGDHCRDCMDSTNILNSELCYECVNVDNCYQLAFSDDCKYSRESYFLRNCRSVANSIFCYGLEHKSYHIFNEPHSKEEYQKKLQELKLHTYSGLQKALKIWEDWSKQFPLRRKILMNCENCTGDSLYNCKNAFDCYNSTRLEDCRYVMNAVDVKDSYDLYAYGEAELSYEFVTAFRNYNVKFSVYVVKSNDMEYCDYCWGCNNCFGCAGLKGKSYCIFNKQYSKEEYKDLVRRIKEKMKADLEYGEFFPIELSPFPYEDSLANDYFPMKEKRVELPQGEYLETNSLSDDVNDCDVESLSKSVYLCPETKKLFQFQKKELEFYMRLKLPIPRVSFEARYKRRNWLVPFPY